MRTLPDPDADQVLVTRSLSDRIATSIVAAGGWIRFDEWMARALYEPGLGYYSGGERKFGEAGDFVTAPELTPLFARCLSVQLAQWFESGVPAVIYEFGAGSGALARDLITALQQRGHVDLQYRIIEVSGSLQARQRETIAEGGAQMLSCVQWLDMLPDTIEGVVLGNEVLDAMPVRLFRIAGERLYERGVVNGSDGGFALGDQFAGERFAELVRRMLDESGWAHQGGWPDGYVSEFGEQAAAWVDSVGRRIRFGAMLLFDYGFPVSEYYHPQRAEGTLVAHYRHRVHADVLWNPGLQDISAHVNFTEIARAGASAGLDLLGFVSQGNFLLACGILDAAAALPESATLERAQQAAALQKLVMESEMGELVKAIAFGRGLPDEALGFALRDRRDRIAP